MTEYLAFALIASLGMLVQSTVGFAGSLLAVPLFSLLMSPRDAVPGYAFLMLAVNSFVVFEGRRHIAWRSVRGLLLGGLPGVPIGALALKHLPVSVIGAAISIVTLLFGLLFLARVRIRFPTHPFTEPLIGLLSGMLGGSISESGPPVVVYGLSRQWPKDVFRSSLLAYFLCLSVTAASSYVALGMVTGRMLLLAAAALLPALAAARLGVLVKERINERAFRLTVLAIILVVSISGLLKHVFISSP
ncbi:MAG TPA: sulfite exporter TauE/SafE family protein [Candidatus Anammoximicrobium sp.]|nr:sulfite exporter TauE/SafE family protein [Candidatus Anammoximicrobium sp.]